MQELYCILETRVWLYIMWTGNNRHSMETMASLKMQWSFCMGFLKVMLFFPLSKIEDCK